MKSPFARTLTIVGPCIVAFTLACGAAPRQRNWSNHTFSTLDQEPNIARAKFDEFRSVTLAGQDPYATSMYAQMLVKYLWEVGPMFDRRNEAAADPELEFKDSAATAGLDREALIVEFQEHVGKIEAVHGYQPGLRHFIAMARKDCETVVFQTALVSSCGDYGTSIHDALDYVTVACDAPQPFCRTLYDMIPDPRYRYHVMHDCAAYVGGDTHEALATWVTEEEYQFYVETEAQVAKEVNQSIMWANLRRAGAAQENARREAQYADDVAAYGAKQGPIESISEIGHLDPADGPPQRPEQVTASTPAKELEMIEVSEQALVVFQNNCDKDMTFGTIKRDTGYTIINPIVVGAGQVASVPMSRCSTAAFNLADNTGSTMNSYIVDPLVGIGVREDCETEYFLSPEQLAALGFAP